MVNILNDIESLFFPNLCLGCNSLLFKNEKIICANCRHELPLTNYHKMDANPMEKIFYGRVQIENATAFLNFEKKNIVQQLIHQLKYKGHEEIGKMIGDWMANELSNYKEYQHIDLVIPVPLHRKKYRKRGYNQVTEFAKSMAKGIGAVYDEKTLIRITNTKTQTLKSRVMRWNTDNAVFSLNNVPELEGKHILLVDDIITTGATLEACARTLQKAKNMRISIATMGITS